MRDTDNGGGARPFDIFSGGGEMGALMHARDWTTTPLGAVENWPQSLRTALGILLDSGYPMYIAWGREYIQFYNDAYRPILGATKHPAALGQSTPECFPEIWDFIGPMFERVMMVGEATTLEDQLLPLDRNGFLEECYFTFSYSAIRDETGHSGGVFVTVIETTERVLSERRMKTLRELAEQATQFGSEAEICARAAKTLEENPHDVPFALVYLLDADGKQAHLTAAAGLPHQSELRPQVITLAANDSPWPLGDRVKAGSQRVTNLHERCETLIGKVWPEAVQEAILIPMAKAGQGTLTGYFIAGISPRLAFDYRYQDFLELTAGHINTAIANARAYEEEKQRVEVLAELNRAKTIFFSNVSHEFRTPLTLLLSPVEDALQDARQPLPFEHRERLEVAHRNALRLLKLVNTLLDFSRIEAGRMEAAYEATDLSQLTTDLAGVFRSAIERAGMQLTVDCPPLEEAVYVDREMWEKIVLNLLSNAFKYTFAGEIALTLRDAGEAVELRVRDTGTGIPASEQPHIFERFYRVKDSRGRTHEGTGIGLALVQELIKLHGGSIRVQSQEDVGSEFTVTIPKGRAHLPQEHLGKARALASTALGAAPFVEESLRWLPDEISPDSLPDGASPIVVQSAEPSANPLQGARIILADDNADMREYVRGLLSRCYEVEALADGEAALAAATANPPDLILTDVMMPRLDGFGLLRQLRADPRTRAIPVIMLSARAGEESKVEGLEAGADDYLIKPFSARELLARVRAHLQIARLRQEATAKVEAALAEAERRARQSEESASLLHTILENVPAGISIAAGEPDFPIIANSRYAYDLIGEPLREVTGKSVGSQTSALKVYLEDGETMPTREQMPLYRAIHCGEEITDEEWIIEREDGRRLIIQSNVSPIRLPDGRIIGAINCWRDITTRKIAEMERENLLQNAQAAREAAESANRLKDEFLATVSHELRTPLNAILGWATLARSSDFNAQEIQHALEIIERSARNQNQIISDILEVSRIMTGKLNLEMTTTPLLPILESAMDTVRPAREAKRIELQTAFADTAGLVKGDVSRLQQVFWNLLVNAVKFTPEGGRIEVGFRRVDNDAEITVCDNGSGIAEEFLPFVFDRFRQADGSISRKHGGLGLGLSIVRHLVEVHGGSVGVASPGLGKGATFTVKLPLWLAPVKADEVVSFRSLSGKEERKANPSQKLSGLRMLVVDDEPEACELVKYILAQHGAEVFTAGSAEAALAFVQEAHVDVLISDLGMPEKDGYYLIRRLRDLPLANHLPAIALTAYARHEDNQRAREAGYQAHLPKPIEADELLQAIAGLLCNTKTAH